MKRALLATLLVAGVVAGSGAAADADASVVARYPAENGSMTETPVVTADDVASAEPTTQHGRPGVTVTLTDAGAQAFTDTLVDAGFTSDNATGNCPTDGAQRNDEGYCLLTVLDGEVVYAAALAPSLADAIEGGAFADDPQLLLATATESNATRLARAFGASVAENTTTARTQMETSDSAENATATTTTTDTSVPGFGVVAALLAVALAVAVLSRR